MEVYSAKPQICKDNIKLIESFKLFNFWWNLLTTPDILQQAQNRRVRFLLLA